MDDESDDMPPEVARQLRAYGALDNPIRLKAYRMLHDAPGLSFNEIARQLGLATGLAAYHVAVLKAADLIDVTYSRRGTATSRYALTAWGEEIFDNLFGRKGGASRRARTSKTKAPA